MGSNMENFLLLNGDANGHSHHAARTKPNKPTKASKAAAGARRTVCLHITHTEITKALKDFGGSAVESQTDCTPAQNELLRRMSGTNGDNNNGDDGLEPFVMRLDLPSDIVKGGEEQLGEAWTALALQHHALRTIFARDRGDGGNNFVQRVLKRPRPLRSGFPDEDRGYAHGTVEPASLFVEWVHDDAPTVPVYLFVPRAAVDRTSLGHVWRDLLSLLLIGYVLEPRLSFPEYLDIATTKRTPAEAAKFWSETIDAVPALAMHSIPVERLGTFTITGANPAAIAGISTPVLRRLAADLGVSDRAVLYTAFGLTLDRHCQGATHEVVFITEGRDRSIAGHASVVGRAGHEYPLKLRVDPTSTLSAALREVERCDVLASSYALAGQAFLRTAARVAQCDFKLVVLDVDEDAASSPVAEQQHTHDDDDGNTRRFPITVTVRLGPRAVSITARHDEAIPPSRIQVLLDHFATALAASTATTMSAQEAKEEPQLADIEIITPAERALLLKMGEPTTKPVRDCVHRLFEWQVLKTPDAPAAQFELDPPLSYDALNRVANRVARRLLAKLAAVSASSPGFFVPVCLRRSLNLVIVLVAVLKAGGAYVTMDPDVPLERNKFIVGDVGARVVIVDRETRGKFGDETEVVIEELIEEAEREETDDSNLDLQTSPEDGVYVIYTSGSTGKPKGVLHIHSSATSGLAAFPTLPDLRQLLFHNPVFSAAQRSVWSTLKQGGCLCLASKDNLTVHIGRTINQMRINVIDVTPSTALLLTPGTVPCLRRMTVAGELINPALIPAWVGELELLNAYGLSENTQVNWRREMVLGQNPQNIGRPSDTTTSFVLVPGTLKLAPLLVPGELCLGGDQLAVRYLNRPEKTAEAFVENPFGPGRLYRTGDMVVAHEDGSVEMVGRIDFQVKINGQRVEPGDSNALIQTHPGVGNSSVVAAEIAGRPGKALVAVIVPDSHVHATNSKGSSNEDDENWSQLRHELKALLEKHIPSYMMPVYWLAETSLPLNVNGKVDIPQLTKYVEGLPREHLLKYSTDHYRDHHHQDEHVKANGDQSNGDNGVWKGRYQNGVVNGHTNGINGNNINGNHVNGNHVNGNNNSIKNDTNNNNNTSNGIKLQGPARTLADVVASALHISAAQVLGTKATFQELGGSSLDAIRVSTAAYQADLELAVPDIMRLPLRELLDKAGAQSADADSSTTTTTTNGDGSNHIDSHHHETEVAPFSLLPDSAKHRFHGGGGGELADVRDAFPTTALQDTFLADSLRGGTSYVYRRYYRIRGSNTSLSQVRSALERLTRVLPTLATTFVPHKTSFLQVVRRSAPLVWEDFSSQMTAAEHAATPKPAMAPGGGTFVCFAGLKDNVLGVTIHHALFDHWSAGFLAEDLAVVLRAISNGDDEERAVSSLVEKKNKRPSYAVFVRHLLHSNKADGAQLQSFWKAKLAGAQPCLLGNVAAPDREKVTVRATLHNEEVAAFAAHNRVSVGSLVHAAWAAVLALQTGGGGQGGGDEVVFGTTLSGRDVHVPGILRMAGPTITTVPLRVRVDADRSLLDLARDVQDALWECAPRSQYGLRNILRAASAGGDGHAQQQQQQQQQHGAQRALFDSLVNVLVQDNNSDKKENGNGNGVDDEVILERTEPHEPNHLEGYAMLEAEQTSTGLALRLLSQLPETKARFLLDNVVATLEALLRAPSSPLGNLNPTTPAEAAFLDSLSAPRPTEPGLLAHSLVLDRMVSLHPDKLALEELDVTSNSLTKQLTFRSLAAAATRFARFLASRDVRLGSGHVIPVCTRKSVAALVAVFGILRAGAAFTPLDPRNPRDRNRFIVREVGAVLAVADSVHRGLFDASEEEGGFAFEGEVINMDEFLSLSSSAQVEEIGEELPSPSPTDLAYIIYTSGSTGLPKGVQVSHAAVAASAEGMIEACAIDSSWRALWFLNYVFDAAYFDVFAVLGAGGALVVAEQDALIRDLAGCVDAARAEQLMVTPTVAGLIRPEEVPRLRALLVCGEPITPEVVNTWAGRVDVYNGYGPTEATILMTVAKVLPGANLKSIGYPLKAVKASILHPETLQPVPCGAVGELCVSGAQVAIGYRNRPEITAKAFLARPDAGADGENAVLYRTGDYARWLPGGEIECLGRRDGQIKLNGFRIELGEIESAVLGHARDLVRLCVVGVAQTQRKKQIVVYYVPDQPHAGELGNNTAITTTATTDEKDEEQSLLYPGAVVDPAAILDRLSSLAHYMTPRIFLPFREFPLLPSGKIDRKRLAAIAEKLAPSSLAKYAGAAPNNSNSDKSAAGGASSTDAELTETETTLRDAWAELFDVPAESIGPNDLFYTYGGDSIAAINLASMLRQRDLVLSVNDAISYPSLREQATRLSAAANKTAADSSNGTAVAEVPLAPFVVRQEVHDRLRTAGVGTDDIEDIYPCGPGQVEFLTQGHSAGQYWQLMTVRPLPAGFDFERWVLLTRQLTAANQILRAMYLRQDEADPLSWVQVILKEPVLDLTIVDCPLDGGEEKTRLVRAHWDARYVLGKPFVRYLVLRHPDGSSHLVTKVDHASYDGTLLRIFDDQFAALRAGLPAPLGPTSFRGFVTHEARRPDRRAKALSFWTEHLRDLPRAPWPRNVARPQVRASVTAKTGAIPVAAYAQRAGVTASVVFQAAYTILLARLSSSSPSSSSPFRSSPSNEEGEAGAEAVDVVYDYLLTGRNVDLDEPQLINGTCANFLPFRSRFSSSSSASAAAAPVRSLLRDTQAGFWQMAEHGSVSLGDIYRALGDEGRATAAKTLFLFQPFDPPPKPAPGGVSASAVEKSMRWVVMAMSEVTMYVNYAVMFEVFKDAEAGQHRLKMGYDSDVFTKEEAGAVMDAYLGILRDVVEKGVATVGELL